MKAACREQTLPCSFTHLLPPQAADRQDTERQAGLGLSSSSSKADAQFVKLKFCPALVPDNEPLFPISYFSDANGWKSEDSELSEPKLRVWGHQRKKITVFLHLPKQVSSKGFGAIPHAFCFSFCYNADPRYWHPGWFANICYKDEWMGLGAQCSGPEGE